MRSVLGVASYVAGMVFVAVMLLMSISRAHDPEALSAEELQAIGRDRYTLDLHCPGKVSVYAYGACPVCETTPVPEPGSYLGLGACVLGLAGLRRWRRDEKV